MELGTFKNTARGKWVGRGLVAVGFIVMCVLVYFQARHGWSMGNWIGDQIGFAVLHGSVDVATALLVSAGAICFAWHMKKMGWAACLFAALLTCVSILWVSGFMSGRIAALAGQKAALDLLEKQGKWIGGTQYKEAGRTERKNLRLEMRENTKEMIKVASVVPDSHAAWLANITGWSVEFCQRILIAISSSVAQAIKYICLLVGFFLLSNRDERSVEANQKTHEGSAGTSDGTSGGGSGSEPPRLTVVPKTEPGPAAIIAVAGTSSLAATTAEAEAVGISSPEPIVVPAATRIFQAPVAVPFHGRSSVDDVDDRVSNGGKRVKAAAPKRKRKAKVPFDQMRRAVRASLVHGERTRTIRDIGEETGWSHTHVLRQIEREEGIQERKQKHLPIRRDPRGLGASLH